MALEMVVMNLLIAPEQSFVASCGGSDGLVVYMNAFRFVGLVMIPANAIGTSLLPVISAQIGQKAPDKVWSTFMYAVELVFIIEAVMGIVLFVFADYLIDLYTYSPEMAALHEQMVLALRIYSVVPIFNGLMHVGNAILKALRKAMLSTVLMFFRELLFLLFYWIAAQISMEAIFWSLDLTNFIAMSVVLAIALFMIKNFIWDSSKSSIVS
jgi:Na+-driven multidrug efflux pump